MAHEIIANRIQFMLSRGFKKVIQPADGAYIIADDKYYYPLEWILNDYLFYKICSLNHV